MGRQVSRQGWSCKEMPRPGTKSSHMAYFAPILPHFSFLQCFLLQVSYAIGVAEPLSVTVFDYGTGTKSSAELNEIVKKNFDLR